MKYYRWLALAWLALQGTSTLAGGAGAGGIDWIGNGGSVVLCRLPAGIETLELLDRYEATQRHGWVLSSFPGADYRVVLHRILDRLGLASPKRAETYRAWLEAFVAEADFIEESLVDLREDPVALPVHCEAKQAVVQIPIEIPGWRRYTVQRGLWDRLGPLDQASLLLHEFVFRERLEAGVAPVPLYVRLFTGRVLSETFLSTDPQQLALEAFLPYFERDGRRVQVRREPYMDGREKVSVESSFGHRDFSTDYLPFHDPILTGRFCGAAEYMRGRRAPFWRLAFMDCSGDPLVFPMTMEGQPVWVKIAAGSKFRLQYGNGALALQEGTLAEGIVTKAGFRCGRSNRLVILAPDLWECRPPAGTLPLYVWRNYEEWTADGVSLEAGPEGVDEEDRPFRPMRMWADSPWRDDNDTDVRDLRLQRDLRRWLGSALSFSAFARPGTSTQLMLRDQVADWLVTFEMKGAGRVLRREERGNAEVVGAEILRLPDNWYWLRVDFVVTTPHALLTLRQIEDGPRAFLELGEARLEELGKRSRSSRR